MKHRKKLLYIGNKLAEHGKSPTSADSLPTSLEREGFKVIVASSKKNKIFRLVDMALVTYKNRKKIDLVIIDTYSTWNFYYAVIIATICRHYKLPYIPILHGGNLPIRLKKNKKQCRKLFCGAKTNVAPSKYLLEIFKEEGYNNLTHIPNTLDIENYQFLLRKSVKPKLLWVRSFAEIYNPLLALEIVEILKKQNIEVELCMVGPEKDGALIRCKEVANELNLPIKFTGLLKKKEWVAISTEYNIFINTTNFDNMPLSVMEAMALGLPVISTNVGGMSFLIDSGITGFLVPSNNPNAFVEVIQDLCKHSIKAEKISQKARFKMEDLDWKIVKKPWIDLLES